MIDIQKDMRGMAVMKSLIESGVSEQEVSRRFRIHLKEIEDYATIQAASKYSEPPLGVPSERPGIVSRPVSGQGGGYPAQNGKTYAFASEKQAKRAYAIQKGAGWTDYQVKALCQKYGFSSTKKIPSGVYEAFCRDLQNGPGNLSESSQHLEPLAEVSEEPPF